MAAISLSHLSSNTRLKLADDDLSVNAYLDQRFTAGNIVVWHHANHSPAEV
jgi:hypothetical protein